MDKHQLKVQVNILLSGYASADSGGHTRPTMTLIRTGDQIILSDPGVVSNHMVIIDALKAEKLSPDDVNIIFITHGHTDHTRNTGLFPMAKIIDYWGWWNGDLFEDYKQGDLGSEIDIINTPGHSYDSISMIIQTDSGIGRLYYSWSWGDV